MQDSFIAQFVHYLSIGVHRLASKMYKYQKAIEGYVAFRQETIPSYSKEAFIKEVFFCHYGY